MERGIASGCPCAPGMVEKGNPNDRAIWLITLGNRCSYNGQVGPLIEMSSNELIRIFHVLNKSPFITHPLVSPSTPIPYNFTIIHLHHLFSPYPSILQQLIHVHPSTSHSPQTRSHDFATRKYKCTTIPFTSPFSAFTSTTAGTHFILRRTNPRRTARGNTSLTNSLPQPQYL